MTHDERVHALTLLGFSKRQASFLVLVMLHSGVCLENADRFDGGGESIIFNRRIDGSCDL